MNYLPSSSGGRNDEVTCLTSSHPGYTLSVCCLSYFTLVIKITCAIKFTHSIIIIKAKFWMQRQVLGHKMKKN